ncbi:MAG: SH3 domain-containing protein [Caldilineaceae bacterium]|nr:SH3 domain-containing protein [Caldilineaceae bacterium]
MQTNRPIRQTVRSHPLLMAGLVTGLLALAACQPIRDPAVIAAEQTAVAQGTPAAAVVAAGTPEAAVTEAAVGPAMATISADSLRVRALPSDSAEVVAGVKVGDTFPVTGISSDGAWIQIAIEESPDGLGWVSAGFVTLAGDITNIEIVDVAAEDATPEATTEATEEATEEATAEATEEATEEATPEATAEVTEEATPEPTAEATEEATPEPTAEATEEATPEATGEAAEEATPVATEEATEEATPEATEEATADLGTVTIVVELPLRVRSEPTTEVENKIGSVYNGEVYKVLEISEDGAWVRIETPKLGDGSGWISAEFVVFNEDE